jgi:hypothetical protein
VVAGGGDRDRRGGEGGGRERENRAGFKKAWEKPKQKSA